MASVDMLVFRDGQWVEAPVEVAPDAVRFKDIWSYYANLIGYARLAMGFLAAFTLAAGQAELTAGLLLGAVLLDWVDGPVARAHNQCSMLGAGVDWLADIQAQILTVAWWVRLDPAVAPWLAIATTVELATCILDFALTAANRYPLLGRKRGFQVILEWCMPGGSYNPFGTFLWLAYPVFCLSWCLDLSWPVRSDLTGQILNGSHRLLLVPAILYIWCELAYFLVLLNHWSEPSRGRKGEPSEEAHDDGPAGAQFLGAVPEPQQALLQSAWEETRQEMTGEWEASVARKEIFWVNLWQSSDAGTVLKIGRVDELDAWVRGMTSTHYPGVDADLDGYGFIVNPVGSQAQAWHIDYTMGYSTLFIPLSPITPGNGMQVLALPPSLPEEAYARATTDLDRVDAEALIRDGGFVSVRQLLPRPFSIIKLDFRAIHRGVANTETFDRIVFFISVKRRGALAPSEPLVMTIQEKT